MANTKGKNTKSSHVLPHTVITKVLRTHLGRYRVGTEVSVCVHVCAGARLITLLENNKTGYEAES